jgi:prolyl-tRNA editing enzyme YbaK/EbsC (Cys-tRNA(Pro) deacylase)
LDAYLQARAVPGEILYLGVPTPTVETAAQAVGTDPDSIVKSILFLVDGRPVLAITCGTDRVETRALAARFGVGRKKVKLASTDIVLRETGYEVGAMPPFGHRQPLQTLLDHRVLEKEIVFAGGGADNALLRISPKTILQTAQAEVVELLTSPDLRPDLQTEDRR